MSAISCEQVDELAGAYALGAVDADEDRSMSEHLATCDQPHVEARDLIGAGAALAASAGDVAPSPGLRDRLMTTVAETPQEHRPQSGGRGDARWQPIPSRAGHGGGCSRWRWGSRRWLCCS